MPDRLPEPDYPARAQVRKVRSNGEIKWQGGLIFISEALIGEAIAIEEIDEDHWQVRFFDVPIGRIDPDEPDRKNNKKLCRLAAPGGGEAAQLRP